MAFVNPLSAKVSCSGCVPFLLWPMLFRCRKLIVSLTWSATPGSLLLVLVLSFLLVAVVLAVVLFFIVLSLISSIPGVRSLVVLYCVSFPSMMPLSVCFVYMPLIPTLLETCSSIVSRMLLTPPSLRFCAETSIRSLTVPWTVLVPPLMIRQGRALLP